MLFNSIEFSIFLPIVFFLYWFVFQRNLKLQNFFLITSSYFFYAWWDWRFLFLITITSISSWSLGLLMQKVDNGNFVNKYFFTSRKFLNICNIVINVSILGFFKYYNFFAESFIEAFSLFGKELNITTLKIIIPLGISFYTFQALSYSIDVYRRKIEATKDIISFFSFISFFPQLFAGPIERATTLLPQFFKKRNFDHNLAIDGTRQILWGLFKKIAIADSCAIYANEIFNNYENLSGGILLIGAISFAVQIYADFSGYSDIAIGTAKLFGFKLIRNFNYPYFSRDIGEFWRRWHISLTSWFRDYIYIPMGGSRVSNWKILRNIFTIFLISGLWHGAGWTFVVWGIFHALLFLPLILTKNNRIYPDTIAKNRLLPNLKEFGQMNLTFILVLIGWVFFRSQSIIDSFNYFCNIFVNFNIQSIFSQLLLNNRYPFEILPIVLLMFVFEWFSRNSETPLSKGKFLTIRTIIILILLIILGNFANYQLFIYFFF